MTCLSLDETALPDIERVLEWFARQDHPEAYAMRPHLMVWAGKSWRIRKGYGQEVIDIVYHVEIDDPGLLARFMERWT